jgi:hypothetical protein
VGPCNLEAELVAGDVGLLAARIACRCTGGVFLQNANDLLFGKPAFAPPSPRGEQKSKPKIGGALEAQVTRSDGKAGQLQRSS